MHELKSFNVMATAKVAGALYAILGEAGGVILAVTSIFQGRPIRALIALLFFGLIYGALGFVITAISAWLYNLIAAQIGGIEFDLVQH
jgi:uncharacterized YccA/Bax inhibitor family protein